MNLKEVDNWTPNQYYDYYQKLMPFYEDWYNTSNGYRPVAIGRNISWWIEKNEFTRKCFVKECKIRSEVECYNLILSQVGNNKLSCWICGKNDKKKRALVSPWERYYNVFQHILWNIEEVKKSNVLKTCRSLYWHNSIRDNKLKNEPTDKSWNEIIGSNFTLDIDIKKKDKFNMFDPEIYTKLYPMITDVAKKLEEEDIEYKIMSSGNGIYFITKRINEIDDIEKDETREVFWNKIAHGWREWINNDLVPIFENHKIFNVDGEDPYTMKFYKSPFSLHQRLDYSAIPTSLDMINNLSSKEFTEVSNPEYVTNNWKDLLNIWK